MYSRLLVICVVIFVLTFGLAGCGSGTQPATGSSQPAGQAPKDSKPTAKKLDFAYFSNQTVSAKVFGWMAEEVTKQSNGELQMTFYPGTLISKELEIIDAVKSGNVAMGSPSGALPSVVPESGVFNVPFLIRDYDHAYKLLNGEVGKQLSELILNKYKLQVVFFYDYGFRHFWNTKRPINKPSDLNGLKMRVMQSKIMTDTVNALGASAVPMAWGDVIPAVQQGVIDGADLPIVNIDSSKVYDVAKYTSLTYHNYGPTMVTMNPDVWKSLTPAQQKLITDIGMQAQKRVIDETASVDSLEGAKKLLESKGMTVNAPDLEAFRKIAEEKVWPQYKKEYADLWDKIVATK